MEMVSLSKFSAQSLGILRHSDKSTISRHNSCHISTQSEIRCASVFLIPYQQSSKNMHAYRPQKGQTRRPVFRANSVNNADITLTTSPGEITRTRKVLVPSLPNELDGNQAVRVDSSYWEWKPKLSVHFEKAGMENSKAPAMLFLPGFGVGTFHFEKQLRDLGRDYRVWAVDYLGLGLSLPHQDPTSNNVVDSEGANIHWGFGDESEPWAKELTYSVDLWRGQVEHFIREVIQEPVYIVGNSLGGFMALYVAASCPQLVKGVTLLNATPFWGFFPNPVKAPRLSKMFPSAGAFPLPPLARRLTKLLWHKIRDPRSVQKVLMQVYADHTTNVDKVFSRIIEITEHPAAAAAFASIMLAPSGQLSFNEALSRCQMRGLPICLMYGREDPWVRPVWGREVKRRLPEAPYYEISPAGHCPHDEVPEVINFLLRGWIKNVESAGLIQMPLLEEPGDDLAGVRSEVEYVRGASRKSVSVQFFGSQFSFWGEMSSAVKSAVNSAVDSFRKRFR